jgi:hypothetical protein
MRKLLTIVGVVMVTVLLLCQLTGCTSQFERHMSRGIQNFKAGEYNEAVSEFTKALEIRPGDMDVLGW